MICSVSVELSEDHLLIMKVAEENNAWITFSKIKEKLPSFNNRDRFDRAIEQLMKDGLVWVDYQPLSDFKSDKGVFTKSGEDMNTVYWFPSLMESSGKTNAINDDLALISQSQ